MCVCVCVCVCVGVCVGVGVFACVRACACVCMHNNSYMALYPVKVSFPESQILFLHAHIIVLTELSFVCIANKFTKSSLVLLQML